MSDDLKAKSCEELLEAVKAEASRRINDRLAKIDALEEELADQRIHGGEMFKRAEKAEVALKLAETTREAWRKEAEALEQEVDGLRAERDHHRQANEALRARNAELEGALKNVAVIFDRTAEDADDYTEEGYRRRKEWAGFALQTRALIDAAREKGGTE